MAPKDKRGTGTETLVRSKPRNTLLLLGWKVFELLYGFITLALFLAKAYTGSRSFLKLSKKDNEQLAVGMGPSWATLV
jgi:hypothetical protein